jgi:hypothetical protein
MGQLIKRKILDPMENTTKSVQDKKKTRKSFLIRKDANALRTRIRTRKTKKEHFHAFFQAIIPIIQEIWTDRCIDQNTPVIGGRIVAEYDSLSKKVNHLYTMKEIVLPEDEMKNIQRITSNTTRRHKPTNIEMANTMETSNRTQHETS